MNVPASEGSLLASQGGSEFKKYTPMVDKTLAAEPSATKLDTSLPTGAQMGMPEDYEDELEADIESKFKTRRFVVALNFTGQDLQDTGEGQGLTVAYVNPLIYKKSNAQFPGDLEKREGEMTNVSIPRIVLREGKVTGVPFPTGLQFLVVDDEVKPKVVSTTTAIVTGKPSPAIRGNAYTLGGQRFAHVFRPNGHVTSPLTIHQHTNTDSMLNNANMILKYSLVTPEGLKKDIVYPPDEPNNVWVPMNNPISDIITRNGHLIKFDAKSAEVGGSYYRIEKEFVDGIMDKVLKAAKDHVPLNMDKLRPALIPIGNVYDNYFHFANGDKALVEEMLKEPCTAYMEFEYKWAPVEDFKEYFAEEVDHE